MMHIECFGIDWTNLQTKGFAPKRSVCGHMFIETYFLFSSKDLAFFPYISSIIEILDNKIGLSNSTNV